MKEIRKQKGYSQEVLSKCLGVHQSEISRIERNEVKPKIKLAKRIAKVLDFDWTLFYEEDSR